MVCWTKGLLTGSTKEEEEEEEETLIVLQF
jgi:hypothetical protein